MSPPADLLSLARTIAANHALDPALVCAVIEQESAWDAHAIRYEPAFRTRYVAPLGLPPTEEVARSISWGLMQVMGQVAREHNFAAKFLSALCDPAAGIEIGCTVLVSKFAIASRNAAFTPSDTRGVSLANLNLSSSLTLPLPSQLPLQLPSSSLDSALATRALQLWNGGGNPNYATEVLARFANYK